MNTTATDNELWNACRDDLKVLVAYIWEGLNYRPSMVQLDMADKMQNGPDRQMITAMRGGAKTYIGCCRVIQILMQNPDAECLIVSKSGDKAEEFSHLIRSWIRTYDLLAPLRARPDQRDNIDKFDVGTRTTDSHSASVSAKGITGTITGGRAHYILVDDVETQDNALTIKQREKLLLKLTECENIIHPGGIIQYNGTFQSEESIYLAIADLGYKMFSWPARYCGPEDGPKWTLMSEKLKQRVLDGKARRGEPTFPERYDEEELVKRESLMGRSQFALQFLLDPSLADEDKFPLKIRDVPLMNVSTSEAPVDLVWATGQQTALESPSSVGMLGDRWHAPMRWSEKWKPYQMLTMTVDPSGKGKDETSWTIGGLLNGRIFLLKTGGNPDGFSEETLLEIAKDAWDNDVREIVCEPTYGGGMFRNLLIPVLQQYYKAQKIHKRPPAVEDGANPTGQKERRMLNVLEPLFRSHKIVASMEVAEDTKLWHQVTRLQNLKGCLEHDDRVDALAQLASHFEENMSVNHERLLERLEREEYEQDVKDFDNSIAGRMVFGKQAKRKKTWINR